MKTCPKHDTRHGEPLSREEQFNLDYAGQARWAIHPRTEDQYREWWNSIHQGCE